MRVFAVVFVGLFELLEVGGDFGFSEDFNQMFDMVTGIAIATSAALRFLGPTVHNEHGRIVVIDIPGIILHSDSPATVISAGVPLRDSDIRKGGSSLPAR
jgi:hypothetical protein